MAEGKSTRAKRPAPKPKTAEATVGGEGSPYSFRREGDRMFCLYGDAITASYDKSLKLDDAEKSPWRWVGALNREFAIAVSGALVARNMHGNLVYTVPAGASADGQLSVGILVGLSFGGSMVETTASVCFDEGALDGDDALEVVRGNCETAARSLVDSVIESRLRP